MVYRFVLGFILCTLASGCTTSGPWPRLLSAQEQRMVEQGQAIPVTPQERMAAQKAAALATQALPALQQAAPPQPITLIASKIAEQRRAFDFANQRFGSQTASFEKALQAFSGKAEAANPSWSNIQLEITRLGQASAGYQDIIDMLNVLAGDVAELSLQGVEVARVLNDIGRLRQATQQAQLEARSKLSQASAKVPKP